MKWLTAWNFTSEAGENATSPLHIHDRCELLYLVSGEAKMQIGSTVYTLKPHTLAIIGALELHDLTPVSYPYARIGMHVDIESLGKIGIPSPLDSVLIERPEGFCHIFDLSYHPHTEDTIREIFTEHLKDDQLSRDMTVLLFHRLLIMLYRLHPEGFSKHIADTEMEKVKKYMEDNFATSISVTALAARCYLTPSHFIVRFKKCTGYTPHKYINLCRADHARRLLNSGKMALDEIAEACGYYDQNSFTRSFKQIMRVTPGQFRLLRVQKNIQM